MSKQRDREPDERQAEYEPRVRERLAKLRDRVVARLAKIAAKTPSRGVKRLAFLVWWNGYHETLVDAYAVDGQGNSVSGSPPFGNLFGIEPPPGWGTDPQRFAGEKARIAAAVVEQLAGWWREAGGDDYPLPATVSVQDEPRAYDLRHRSWTSDESQRRRAQEAAELADLVRERMARLRARLVEKLRKITARPPSGRVRRLHFELFDVSTDFSVVLFLEDDEGRPGGQGRTIFSNQTLPGHDEIDWTPSREAGVDVSAVIQEALIDLLADAWEEAGGRACPLQAVAGYHDDAREYDLVRRRWVTDHLGRPSVG